MHTFRPSRGRVLFEVFCALGIAACFAGGWIQTGAWAFLPAAIIATLYSLVHAFDVAGRPAFVAADGALEMKANDHLPTDQDAGVPRAASDQPLAPTNAIEGVGLVEPEAPPETQARKTKAPRKARSRRKPTEDRKITEPVPLQKEETPFADAIEEEEIPLAELPEEVAHIPLAPLFEPEPFVRQQRAVFGRKAG